MAPKKPSRAWVSSEGKKLLDRDIRKNRVTRAMPIEEVFNMHRAEFEWCGKTPEDAFRLFEGRLKSAFERADDSSNRATREAAMLQQDRATHPRPALTARGTPQWEGSAAQQKMEYDVKWGLTAGLTQSQIRLARPEYQAYSAQEIGQHHSQEQRKQKWYKNHPGRIKSLP